MQMTAGNGNKKGQPPLTFTLDGVEYTVEDRKQPAADVLRLAGLDPADYDLLRVVGNDQDQRYHDQEEVQLVPHGKYMSFFTGSTPVV